MYIFLLLVLLTLSGLILWSGFRTDRPARTAAGVLLLSGTILFFALLDFWGEMLWFAALGFGERFWTVVRAKAGLSLSIGLLSALLASIALFLARVEDRMARRGLVLAGALIGAFWGFKHWDVLLLYLNRVASPVREPILGREAGFYLFVLPFYDAIYWLLILMASLLLIAGFIPAFQMQGKELRIDRTGWSGRHSRIFAFSLGNLLLVLGWGQYLNRFHLMYSTAGVVTGPGWTDVHIRLPAYTVVALVTFLAGLILMFRALIPRPAAGSRQGGLPWARGWTLLAGTLAAVWLLALLVVPSLLQKLLVEPNEITYEKPYIAHNIRLTRVGFGLEGAEEREFPVSGEFTRQMIDANRNLLSEIRLWDWRALKAVHKQFQEIRLYYEFDDVDIDRYTLDGRYRQVMVSTREMELSNLPEQSQTFVNQRFKYTHGHGLTMTPVSEFTEEGLPNFLLRDIPPATSLSELKVSRPQIYFGELTDSHAFVNTTEEEFDYPSGDQNVYIHYPGSGGVELTSLWTKFIYGWKFDGTKFFLSSYPRKGSRVLFHRQVRERVQTLAPFLVLDDDPYIVLVDGKLFWIIDAYTQSGYFPYSEHFSSLETIEYSEGDRPQRLVSRVSQELEGANYLRNSVKAVVDAFDGSVDLYIFEPDDSLIQVWRNIFPGLFKAREEMPQGLLAHIRYPSDYLLTQGLVYAKYHMSDPEVFYNQEDLWVRATEKYHAGVQPVEPYYVMWEAPGSDRAEFVLILPFTPKNRQVLIGWMAGMCDPSQYGRLLAYKFPKEKRVLGPQQMETKIDQDRFLSGQLTLWDQRGSQVIRGNVLVIPIEDTLIYVEPIYLQAETAAYPELRLVAVMHGDRLSYAEDFQQAIEGLFGVQAAPLTAPDISDISPEQLARRASQAFDNYLRLQAEGNFIEAARELEILRESLQQLAGPGESNR